MRIASGGILAVAWLSAAILRSAMRRSRRRPVVVASLECTDAGQTMADIEGVGNLALLAVANTVDSSGDLFGDDLLDSRGKARLERRLVNLAAGFARLQQRQQIG